MKKFIFLLSLAALGVFLTSAISYAQVGQKSKSGTMLSTSGKGLDTLTDAGTENEALTLKGYFGVVTFQTVFRRISGTAAATATLQGSLDGTNWYTIGSAYTVTNLATQNCVFTVVPSTSQYYRLNVVGSGSQSLEIKPLYIARHPSN